jgi:hypothetical protein
MSIIPIIFRGETSSAVRQVRALREEESRLQRQTRETGTTARRTHGELDRMGRGALAGSGAFRHLGRSIAFASGAFLGAAGFVSVVRKSIDAARDLQIQQARSDIVFGDSSKSVQAWSETTTRELSLVRSDALTSANAFGTMLTAMKVAPGVASGLAEEMVKVAAAISLARGEDDPSAAVKAITVGLAGRGRALRQYGIILDEVSLKAEALRLGLVKASVDAGTVERAQLKLNITTAQYADAVKQHGQNSTQAASALLAQESAHASLQKALGGSKIALTNQQKAQAAASLVIQQGARFVKSYGTLMQTTAGQQREFRAGVDDLEEQLGRQLLPAFTNVLRKINPYLQSLQEGGSRHRAFVRTAHQVGQGLHDVAVFANAVRIGLGKVVDQMGGWRIAFAIVLSGLLARRLLAVGTAAIVMGQDMRKGALMGNKAFRSTLLGAAIFAAFEIITHWKRVKAFFNLFWVSLQIDALAAYKQIVEPFSHLPGRMGAWARKAKENVNVQLAQLAVKAGEYGRAAGVNFGGAFDDAMTKAGWHQNASGTWSPDVGTPHGRSAKDIWKGMPNTPGPGVTYTGQHTTHETKGLPGYPAVDIMAHPGTPVLAPENGAVIRHSGHPPSEPPPEGQGGPWGLSLYFLGASGTTYYMTHLMWVAPLGRYRKGAMIGKVGNYPGGADHVHIGVHRGGGAYTPPAGDTGGGGAPPSGDTGGGLTVDHPGSKPPKISRASAASITRERHTISEGLLDLKGDLEKKYVTPKQYAAYVAAIRKILRALSRPHLTSAQFSSIVNQYRALWDNISRAVERGRNRVRKAAEAAAAAHKKAIEDAESVADVARQHFEDAWSKMADNILTAFDRITAAGENAIQQQYAAATPAEAALQALENRRSAQSTANAVGDAQTKLQRAREIGDPAMIKEAMDELQSAQDDALEGQLQSQAEIERAAADKARDDAIREYDDLRQLQRDKLQEQLDELEAKLESGKISWKDAQEAIKKLIGDDIGPFAELGATIGQTFMQALLDSITNAGTADGPLAQALNKLKALGYRWNPDTGEWEPIPKGNPGAAPGSPVTRPRPGTGGPGGGGVILQEGGIYMGRKPLKALLHGPEAVIPLSDPRAAKMLGDGGSGAPGTVYELHFHAPVGAAREFAQDLRRELLKIEDRNTNSLWGK